MESKSRHLFFFSWYHGRRSRKQVENLLQPPTNGLFIVSESEKFPGQYVLSVCCEGQIHYYVIRSVEKKVTIDDKLYFYNISQLISHYKRSGDGICCKLANSVNRENFMPPKTIILRNWLIQRKDLLVNEKLYDRENSTYYKGVFQNRIVNIKAFKDDGKLQKLSSIDSDAFNMTSLVHKNIIRFFGLVFGENQTLLVMEYVSNGSLVDYLRSYGRKFITKKNQIDFAFDICSGMQYLEAKNILHKDLAARNILLSETCVAKISDFGLAGEQSFHEGAVKLPIKWSAPEAFEGKFSNKSDMWSYGILLWEIYSFGRTPYPRLPSSEVQKHIKQDHRMDAPTDCPKEMFDIMIKTWHKNPNKRPTFNELHSTLSQIQSTVQE